MKGQISTTKVTAIRSHLMGGQSKQLRKLKVTQVGETTGDRHEAKLQADLKVIEVTVQQTAQTHQGDLLALLSLLRILEGLHQKIRDGLFQEVLPTNRQALYGLLRDIEAEGGWPYIPRMKLQALLAALQSENLRDDRD